jgi:hypothetical protein
VKNEEWYTAMSFGADSINLYLNDEQKFINELIMNEIELMVTGIENFLQKNKFLLTNYSDATNAITGEYKFEAYELLEFRAEKITGALEFVDIISTLKTIKTIDGYINRIENCSKSLIPILEMELQKITEDLRLTELEIARLKPKYDVAYENWIQAKTLPKKLPDMFANLSYTSMLHYTDDVDKRFEDYNKLKNKYLEARAAYNEITNLIQPQINKSNYYAELKRKFTQCLERHNNYFALATE